MKKFSRIASLALALAMVLSLAACSSTSSSPTTAQPTASPEATQVNFPTDSITIVVPFAPGGNVDLCCRIIGEELSKDLGVNVQVENKAGGGAIIGQTYALGKDPDGYTILALTSSFVTNVLSGDAEYTMEDEKPVCQFCYDPEVLVVSKSSGITTYEEFVAAATEKSLLNSTPGYGTSHHIASLLYGQDAGINFEYLHTNGSADQTVQLAGGHADCGFTTYGGAATLISTGDIIPLAIAASERSAKLPDMPTMVECGNDFAYGAYRGFGVPAGTPDEIVVILEAALAKVMASDTVVKQFSDSGFPISYMDSADFSTMLNTHYEDMKVVNQMLNEG